MAGSKPGERRGGRQKGTPNKVVPEVKLAAREYTAQALERLAKVMLESDSDAAAVSACNALLDRGWGKPAQSLTGVDGAALFPAEIGWRRVDPKPRS